MSITATNLLRRMRGIPPLKLTHFDRPNHRTVDPDNPLHAQLPRILGSLTLNLKWGLPKIDRALELRGDRAVAAVYQSPFGPCGDANPHRSIDHMDGAQAFAAALDKGPRLFFERVGMFDEAFRVCNNQAWNDAITFWHDALAMAFLKRVPAATIDWWRNPRPGRHNLTMDEWPYGGLYTHKSFPVRLYEGDRRDFTREELGIALAEMEAREFHGLTVTVSIAVAPKGSRRFSPADAAFLGRLLGGCKYVDCVWLYWGIFDTRIPDATWVQQLAYYVRAFNAEYGKR